MPRSLNGKKHTTAQIPCSKPLPDQQVTKDNAAAMILISILRHGQYLKHAGFSISHGFFIVVEFKPKAIPSFLFDHPFKSPISFSVRCRESTPKSQPSL
jgi:hypothetical protein